jgi:hypothetical protein
MLRVVRGDATPEELAAWGGAQPRRPLPAPGPGAWRAAARDARTRATW